MLQTPKDEILVVTTARPQRPCKSTFWKFNGDGFKAFHYVNAFVHSPFLHDETLYAARGSHPASMLRPVDDFPGLYSIARGLEHHGEDAFAWNSIDGNIARVTEREASPDRERNSRLEIGSGGSIDAAAISGITVAVAQQPGLLWLLQSRLSPQNGGPHYLELWRYGQERAIRQLVDGKHGFPDNQLVFSVAPAHKDTLLVGGIGRIYGAMKVSEPDDPPLVLTTIVHEHDADKHELSKAADTFFSIKDGLDFMRHESKLYRIARRFGLKEPPYQMGELRAFFWEKASVRALAAYEGRIVYAMDKTVYADRGALPIHTFQYPVTGMITVPRETFERIVDPPW